MAAFKFVIAFALIIAAVCAADDEKAGRGKKSIPWYPGLGGYHGGYGGHLHGGHIVGGYGGHWGGYHGGHLGGYHGGHLGGWGGHILPPLPC